MRRTLSSPLTVLWKFIFPTLTITLFVGWLIARSLGYLKNRDGSLSTPQGLGLSYVLATVVAGFLIWYAKRLKRIQVDKLALYVSNYVTEVRIPLSDVNKVTESWDRRYFTLTIHLRQPCLFGDHIEFRPKLRLYWRGLHPVALELQALVDAATVGGAAPPG